MVILLLHRASGMVTVEAGNADDFAYSHGFDAVPTVLDGDECVKMMLGGSWVATAQAILL